MKLLPKMNPSYAVFDVPYPLDPGTKYGYNKWYRKGTKVTVKKCISVVFLNKCVAKGKFNEAGRYIFVMRQDGWKIRYAVFKKKDAEKILNRKIS